MHVKRFATFCNVLKTNANFYVASRDAGSSRHCYQTSQAKKRPFLAPKSRRGPHQAKKSPRSRTSQSRPDKQVEEKEKPQVRGCRTLVLCGTGRQDSPGRGDGLGWTTSTPPDSNGVPRDVLNVSRGHRARSQPTEKSVLTRKPSPHQIRMSVFWAHQRKSSASIGSQTGGKSAHRSKPAKSRPDRPGKKSKPHGTEVGLNWVRYPQTDPDAPGCKGTLG